MTILIGGFLKKILLISHEIFRKHIITSKRYHIKLRFVAAQERYDPAPIPERDSNYLGTILYATNTFIYFVLVVEKLEFIQHLESLTAARHRITPRNNLERYGFTHVLKNRWGKKILPRSFCEWVHGWCWWPGDLRPEDLIYDPSSLPPSQWLLVTNELEKNVAITGGITKVVAAGLPLLYTIPKKLPSKKENTLLAFLEHSAEAEKDHGIAEPRFLDYLADIRKDFEFVGVSIFGLDYTDEVANAVKKRGLIPLIGADPSDATTFDRICNYFSLFSNVTGNCMGSYIAYALYFGKDVYLPGLFYKRDYSIFQNTESKFPAEHISRLEYFYSENYARQHYGFLFSKDRELDAPTLMELGKKYLGESNMLSREELEYYLGWKASTQCKEYINGGVRRIARNLKKPFQVG